MVAQRNITSQELDSTWICFDSHNQKCMRLSEFASQDATAKLCPNLASKGAAASALKIPCDDRLRPAPTTIPFNAFSTSYVCGDDQCSANRSKSIDHYLKFLNQAVEALDFVRSGGPLIASESKPELVATAAAAAPAAAAVPPPPEAPQAPAQAPAQVPQAPAPQAPAQASQAPAAEAPETSAATAQVETDFSLFD